MSLAGEVATSFGLGLATPLSAVCVVPLYPGFLAFLSSQGEDAPSVATLAALVAAGVVLFMAAVGVVFTTLLGSSLTGVVGVVSPVAFGLLALFGVALLADLHPQSRLPSPEPPQTRYPSASALAYGAFFGAIVLPCNPGFISVFFARAFLFADPVASLANFGAFGAGMGRRSWRSGSSRSRGATACWGYSRDTDARSTSSPGPCCSRCPRTT